MDGHSIPEDYEKEGSHSLKALYDDLKNVLKVPIVNDIFRTAALYEQYLQTAWKQVRPNMLTFNVKKAAQSLQYSDLGVKVPQIDWPNYYNKPTLERIERTINTLNDANTKLLLIASAWAESLAGRPNSGGIKVTGTVKAGVASGLPPIELIRISQAPPPIRSLLLDMAERHHHMYIACDFRALAHYPQFLRTSWVHLRQFVGTTEYVLLREQLRRKSVRLTKDMPYPVTLNSERLSGYYSPREIAGITGIVSMFQNVLPDLIIDGEFFRRILVSKP